MAFESQLPLPTPEWVWDVVWPVTYTNQATTHSALADVRRWAKGGNLVLNSNFGFAGVTNGPADWDVYRGRACAFNNGANVAMMTYCPVWHPNYGPASGLNPGAYQPAFAAVYVYDIFFALASAAAVYTPDLTGWWWVPTVTAAGIAPTFQNVPPGGPAPSGGFGLCVNDDGGGNAIMQFISFLGAAILQRTQVPAAWTPDLTKWNAARIIIISADAAQEARLSVQVNGNKLITDQPFDDVLLMRPNTVVNRTLSYGVDFVVGGSASKIYYGYRTRLGNSLPDGTPVQVG